MPPILPEQAKTDDRLVGQLDGLVGRARHHMMEIALCGPTLCHGKPSTRA